MYFAPKMIVINTLVGLFAIAALSCNSSSNELNDLDAYLLRNGIGSSSNSTSNTTSGNTTNSNTTTSNQLLPNIDLSHWKITLPIGNPTSVSPPEILDYANNETLKPFFYNDSSDGSLVFYTYPGATTTNSSYSRTELREQMVAGDDNTNWTFAQGGQLRGTLSVPEVSVDASGNPHRVIVMQIHGRLTNAQKEQIGASDNNAPPVLKIYWYNGRVRVKTKQVKDLEASDEALLHKDAWEDDPGITFPVDVGHEKFTLAVNVSNGFMEVTLNDEYTATYQDVHMEKWGIFENYFKAGNYLQTTDAEAFSKVKYYSLEVSHQ